MAACLSVGPDGALSHLTGARIGRLDGVPPHRHIHLSGPVNGRRRADWLLVHRREIPPEAVTSTGPLVHTTHLRTLRDSCALLDDLHIERMLESVIRSGTELRLVEELAAGELFWGRTRLLRVLGRRPAGAPPTGSELETRFEQLVRLAGLPPPARQFVVERDGAVVAKLDHAWPRFRAFVESDSRLWHDRDGALLYDRHRQNDVVNTLGWLPIRVTWVDVTRHPTNTIRWTAEALRRGGWCG
jgi:hypothetical protein